MKTINLQHEWNQLENCGVPLEPIEYRVRPRYDLLVREAWGLLGSTERPTAFAV
jgi:hypothetical protein